MEECIQVLVEVGVDVLVVDIVYGYFKGVLEWVCWVFKYFFEVQVIGGNIVIGDVVLVLVEVGVYGVKVGIGFGLICIICIVFGIGVFQIIVVGNVVVVLKGKEVLVIVDGGICFFGDIVKVIVVGVYFIMVGGLLVGIEEVFGEVELY